MNALQNLAVKYKISAFSLIAMVGFIVFLAFNAHVISQNNDRLARINEVDFAVLESVNENWVNLIRIETTFTWAIVEESEELLEEARVLGAEIQGSFKHITETAPETASQVVHIESAFTRYFELANQIVVGSIEGNLDRAKKRGMLTEMRESYSEFKTRQEEFKTDQAKRFANTLTETQEAARNSMIVGVGIAAVVVIVLFATGLLLTRLIVNPLEYAVNIVGQISEGDWNVPVSVTSQDETGRLLSSIVSMRDTLRDKIQEDLSQQNEALDRIKTALDSASTNTVITNTEGKIYYCNKAFYTLRDSICSQDSRGNRDLENTNLFDLHNNIGELKGLIQNISKTQKSELRLDDSTYSIVLNPVTNEAGDLIGVTLEWQDLTAELNVQLELDRVVKSTLEGDFNQRVDVGSMHGVMRKLGLGVNKLIETTSDGLDATAAVLKAISEGDLDKKVEQEFPGAFGELSQYCNHTVDTLKHIIGDLKTLVVSANNGDFTARISLDGFSGYQRDVADDVNQLMKVVTDGIGEVNRVLHALSKGNLTETISIPLPGEFGELKNHCNNTVYQMRESMGEISNLVNVANAGKFTLKINLETKTGFFKELGESLNLLMSTTNGGLTDVQQVLSQIAQGNLTDKMPDHYEGAFGQLSQDANNTVEKLTSIINSIRTMSNSIVDGTAQVIEVNSQLNTHSNEQRSSLESTREKMGNTINMIKSNYGKVDQVNKLTSQSTSLANEGGKEVVLAIQSMRDIKSSSDEISNIISVINDIAFQTNLLALNASVEAARAGEQGKGFSVVAGEVGNLAKRCSSSAKQIRSLIENSLGKIESGSSLVNKCGDTLTEIISAISNVSRMTEEISESSKIQEISVNDVSNALEQMNHITNTNIALVDQTSASSQNMEALAREMREMLGYFKCVG